MDLNLNHFDGRKYYNSHVNPRRMKDVIKWLWKRKFKSWPRLKKIQPKKPPMSRVPKGELWVTFINHSTVLIQLDGVNLLTDPIWSERAGPLAWAGLRRIYKPGIKFRDLPPIDAVLISHNHYDHLDKRTLIHLELVHRPVFYTLKGNARLLKKIGLEKVFEFDWWESKDLIPNLTMHIVPAQHSSGRGIFDRDKALWGGFLIEGLSKRVYFAGDTGYGPFFKEIRNRIGSPHLSILPIGAFKPEWAMHSIHMSPKQAIQAHLDLESEKSLAVHFGTFHLGDERFDEAPSQLKKILQKKLSLDSFWILEPGEGRQVISRP